jgi:EAL domain-containing protein (putative c-di-GMP-specific phosphodiesterase class I)
MRLPVQELKIDRSFISRMASDPEIATIVRSTIDLGHNLNLKVVAEGVEDLAEWKMLRVLGCDDAQGFLMSKPLEPRSLVVWIRANDKGTGLTRTLHAAEIAASGKWKTR